MPLPAVPAAIAGLLTLKNLFYAGMGGMILKDTLFGGLELGTERKLGKKKLALEEMIAKAQIEAAKTEKGKAYGTPYYISPEQIRGEMDIDGRADIYGLGATFYHLVTGRVPYMAEDPVEVMKKHLKDELVPPDHINTTLSSGVSEVIEVMMAKNRDNRYSNIDELLVDLRAVRAGEAPMRAHKRIDVSVLEQLEDGEAIEETAPTVDVEQVTTKYKTIILALGAVSAVLLLIIILLLLR